MRRVSAPMAALAFFGNYHSCLTRFRAFWPLALALASLTVADGAKAGVGGMSGGAPSSFAHLSPVQTVQSGECWYDNGPDGPGYYPCGNEWNNGLGGIGTVGPIVGPAIRRHHRHRVVVVHPKAANPIYPGAPSRRLGVGVPSAGLRGGVGGVRTSPNFHAGATTVTPGFTGGGFHGGLGGGNFHQFHAAGVPHIGAPVSPGFTGGGGLHGLGAATESISARLRPQVLRASGLSVPAAGWGLPTSARSPRQVLLAEGFTALEGAELSRAPARGSGRAASDIAEHAGARAGRAEAARASLRSPRA